MPMQPKPISDTSRPLFPSLRFCIGFFPSLAVHGVPLCWIHRSVRRFHERGQETKSCARKCEFWEKLARRKASYWLQDIRHAKYKTDCSFQSLSGSVGQLRSEENR